MKKSNKNKPAQSRAERAPQPAPAQRTAVQIYPQEDGRTFIVATPVAKKKAKVKPAAKPKTVKPIKAKVATPKAKQKTVLKTAALEPTSITGAKPGLTAFFNGFTLRSKNGKR